MWVNVGIFKHGINVCWIRFGNSIIKISRNIYLVVRRFRLAEAIDFVIEMRKIFNFREIKKIIGRPSGKDVIVKIRKARKHIGRILIRNDVVSIRPDGEIVAITIIFDGGEIDWFFRVFNRNFYGFLVCAGWFSFSEFKTGNW